MEIHFDQILFQMINFGVVAGALTILLYKPILKTLRKRSEKIAESQKAAEKILQEKEDIDAAKKQVAAKAKKEAAKLMAEANKEADEKKAKLMAEAKQEIKDYKKTEKTKWEQEKSQLRKDFRQELRDAVFLVSERVLGKGGIDKKTHAKLIDDSIKQLAA